MRFIFGAFAPVVRSSLAVVVCRQYGLDANNDMTFIALGPGQRLAAMMSGVVDAGLLSTEDRYSSLDQGDEGFDVPGERGEKFLGNGRNHGPFH